MRPSRAQLARVAGQFAQFFSSPDISKWAAGVHAWRVEGWSGVMELAASSFEFLFHYLGRSLT